MPRSLLVCLATATLCLPSLAQTPPAQPDTKTDAQLDAEATQANELREKSQILAALPLYEDLNAHRPKNPEYLEGLAMAYVARGAASGSKAAKMTDLRLALKTMQAAEAAGDKSGLSQVMIEKLTEAVNAPDQPDPPSSPGQESFNKAEQLFSKGDLPGAIILYAKSWQENPNFYQAPLYAGDSEYKLDHYDEAGIWFARAIAIEPDAETAHRYWADCLMKAGKPAEARKHYIEAFIADPYQKAPRLSLRGYASITHILYVAPPITLPAPPSKGKNGNINITLNMPSDGKADPLAPIWLAYSMSAALWQGDKFKKQFPNEKEYRHSLAEEVDTIHTTLTVVRELKIKDADLNPTLRSLLALEKDNMIECWILLDAPDQGTAQDYVAYRATHRDLLRAYIEKYDLHPA
jgi:tetratricopeptide (TPR) repeat protein